MSSVSPPLQPVRDKWSGLLLTVLFLVFAVVLFAGIYLALPYNQHFWALIAIGILSLLFSLGSYMAESLSRQATAQRSLAWGFFGMGFAVLLLTIGLGPAYGITTVTGTLFSLALIIVALIVAVALIAWRGRAVRATENQEVPRSAWRAENAPSAFSYATAKAPSVPSTAPPASPPSPPGGGTPPPPRSP